MQPEKVTSKNLCTHCGGTGFQGDEPCEFCAASGREASMPQGARETECEECEYTYGTHAPQCSLNPDREPREPDGECYRGGEYAAELAESQAWIQRNLK